MKGYQTKGSQYRPRIVIGGAAESVPSQLLKRLEREGYSVEFISSGNAIVEALRAGRFDVAVVDVLTPGKDGIQILVETRTTDVPIILYSAQTGVRLPVEAMKRGAADYLLQPLQAGELLEALREALAKRTSPKHTPATIEDDSKMGQARRLETLGRLTAAVAHDLNNQTTIIMGYCELLLAYAPENSTPHDHLEEIRRAALRSANLTRQLLAFGRKKNASAQVADLNALINGMAQMLELIVGEKVELHLQLDAEPARVIANSNQIEQVVINLVLNARDAMPRGGRLTLKTANVILDEVAAPGSYVMFSASDNGMGMDEATQAQLFEPFFTTKAPGHGTGLGLTVVKQTVEQCRGRVEVSSRPGEGTTFSLYFPESLQETSEPPAADPSNHELPVGTETVLLAEDDEDVRAMLHSILKRQGYSVLEARNGREVTEICETYNGAIHLLLTDVVMPDCDGPDLAQQVAARHPDIRVLLISGYAEPVLAERTNGTGPTFFLQKPFTAEALASKIREALNPWE